MCPSRASTDCNTSSSKQFKMLREEGVWQQTYIGVNRKKNQKKNPEYRTKTSCALSPSPSNKGEKKCKEESEVERIAGLGVLHADSTPCLCHTSWPRQWPCKARAAQPHTGGSHLTLSTDSVGPFTAISPFCQMWMGVPGRSFPWFVTTAVNARGWWHPFGMPGDIPVHCRALDEMTSKGPFQLMILWFYEMHKVLSGWDLKEIFVLIE